MLSLNKKIAYDKSKDQKKSVEMLEHFRRSYDFSKTSQKEMIGNQLTPVK
jgi:hypothetical protein